MPWTVESVDKHYGGLDTKHKKMWVEVANSALKSCMDKGGDVKECEVSAIRQASSVVKKNLEDPSQSFYYLTEIDDSILKELEDKTTIIIDMFREGKWHHPSHGIIQGTKKLFNDFIKNWKENIIGRDIMIDKNHKPEDGGTGLIKDLFIDGDKLKAKVELTNFGIDLIKNFGFRYFSPEYTSKYTNKETGAVVENVLIGGALTLRPFLTNLSPIVLSENCLDSFSLHQEAIATSVPYNSYYMDFSNSFIDIIRQLCYGGYISQSELKDFTLNHLEKVNFDQLQMSEEFKKEILTLLEEYFNETN